jgi:DNA-binding CsgD family transcriptional regulator
MVAAIDPEMLDPTASPPPSAAGQVLSALCGVARSPAAFLCLSPVGRSPIEISRAVAGHHSVVRVDSSIEDALGFDPSILLATGRSVVAPGDVARWRGPFKIDGFSSALLVFLQDGCALRGVAGVARRCTDRGFSAADVDSLAALQPLLSYATRSGPSDEGSAPQPAAEGPGASGRLDELTPREVEIAELLAAGYTCVNIAARCGLSPHTIRTYIRRVHAKLGVCNRADLVRQVLVRAGRTGGGVP